MLLMTNGQGNRVAEGSQKGFKNNSYFIFTTTCCSFKELGKFCVISLLCVCQMRHFRLTINYAFLRTVKQQVAVTHQD